MCSCTSRSSPSLPVALLDPHVALNASHDIMRANTDVDLLPQGVGVLSSSEGEGEFGSRGLQWAMPGDSPPRLGPVGIEEYREERAGDLKTSVLPAFLRAIAILAYSSSKPLSALRRARFDAFLGRAPPRSGPHTRVGVSARRLRDALVGTLHLSCRCLYPTSCSATRFSLPTLFVASGGISKRGAAGDDERSRSGKGGMAMEEEDNEDALPGGCIDQFRNQTVRHGTGEQDPTARRPQKTCGMVGGEREGWQSRMQRCPSFDPASDLVVLLCRHLSHPVTVMGWWTRSHSATCKRQVCAMSNPRSSMNSNVPPDRSALLQRKHM
ncbi:hypothetical protein B0H19DRAFT_1231984 [Mycena capillaripes]|nr:hypothetical protein B0H19DRAFT_1231984 [Mycena capillaripes]